MGRSDNDTSGNDSGNDDTGAIDTSSFNIGGVVTGLNGSVILRNNDGDDLTVNNNGDFSFSTSVSEGATYSVTVLSQPTGQNCVVTNGNGSATSDVNSVTVNCMNLAFTLGGTASGLNGTAVLQNNGGDDLTINDGDFTFETTASYGESYHITILDMPYGQSCTMTGTSGTVNANVTSILVSCVNLPATRIESVTDSPIDLVPYTNGTYWSRGFVIDDTLYQIDRENGAMWSFNVNIDSEWHSVSSFPGDDNYSLVASANGKGYAAQSLSTNFWEYNPAKDEWKRLDDLPTGNVGTSWRCYNDLCYFPAHNGIYAFNPSNKQFSKVIDIAGGVSESGAGDINGAVYLVDGSLYWYGNTFYKLYQYDIDGNALSIHNQPYNFPHNSYALSVFVLNGTARIVYHNDIWTFDSEENLWTVNTNSIGSGNFRQAFVIDDTVYALREDLMLKRILIEK